ncbi:hypothetical protein HXZ62_05540 [Empedobacter falsenii]|uniref:energy transducer TonB n=1 Tax=Empedobacter falsenii TaxID=343874 RepID=UPI002576A32C|nr:hypothetical protein [Empedobacter falsenii]MDM1062030.1 hypothetical protein [Empedobacter falsenii]MDM1546865.1 hypothetical protein [Empedobacter falsenii]
MKRLILISGIFLSQFLFAQKIYTKNQVDKEPTFSACNNRIDEQCFSKKLISELTKKLSDFLVTLPKGVYKSTINFTINEDGKFTNYKYSGNKKLGEESVNALKIIMLKQEKNKVKVIPANIKGKAVKMSYSLPVNIKIDA